MQQDPLELTKKIIACESVTPSDAGSLKIFADLLSQHGFSCEEINRGQTKNLWAKYGSGAPVFLFAGHVDVVPPGADGWKFPPFVPTEDEGFLYGRGAQDMKTSDACFAAAACEFVSKHPQFKGTIVLLLTSDEEGDGKDGTQYALQVLSDREVAPDFCIVGEPSCTRLLGDTIKNGRRGSLNGKLTVRGIQGHVAYPKKVRNPIHSAAPLLAELSGMKVFLLSRPLHSKSVTSMQAPEQSMWFRVNASLPSTFGTTRSTLRRHLRNRSKTCAGNMFGISRLNGRKAPRRFSRKSLSSETSWLKR